MSDELAVDIWSDVMCPWCAIGYSQFSRAVEELAGDVDVTVLRFMPFELNPAMPLEGRGQAELLAENYRKSAEEVAEMRRAMEDAAEKAGFSMAYAGEGEEPEQRVWNTHDAHKLLRWALTAGEPEAQARLKMAMFRAHFQQRRNMADRELLLNLAEAEGFDRAAAAEAMADDALSMAVKLEEKRGLENGISSVPTFVVNGKYILQGASDAESYKQALVKLASMEAMA